MHHRNHPRSTSAGRGFAVAGAVLIVLLGGAIAASATGSTATHRAQEAPPAEALVGAGPQAVAGPDGTVGWIDEADWVRANEVGPPLRSFGTGDVQLQSLDVHDQAGGLVGYYTTGPLGFVPLATAEDPAAMDELLAGLPPALTHDQAKALHEEVRAEGT